MSASSSIDQYAHNNRITFRARVTSTSDTNVFVCPYGFGIRFKLLKLAVYNEAAAAVTVSLFDRVVTGTVTDPPAQGSATDPLIRLTVPTVADRTLGANEVRNWTFNQGLAVSASAATVVVEAEVIEV